MYAIDQQGVLVKASGRAVLDYLNLKYADSRKFGRNTFKLTDSELVALGVRRVDSQSVELDAYQHEVDGDLVAEGDRATLHRTAEDTSLEHAISYALARVTKLQDEKQRRGIEIEGHRISTEPQNVSVLNSIHYALIAGQEWPAENISLKTTHIESRTESRLEVNQETFLLIMRNIGQLMYEANNEAQLLETEISACDAVSQLRAIDIDGGFS